MIFHLIGLPHTKTSNEYNACAFTIKLLRFIKMMTSLGHTCYHYGAEGSEVDCENIITITDKEQTDFFGEHDPKKLYALDWSGKADYWKLFNSRTIDAINQRIKQQEFVGSIFGTLQKPIADSIKNNPLVVEYGIGYNGTYAKYRVFESYAHMHKLWGAQDGYDPDGKFYDTVIPNYLDPSEYPFIDKKSDYFLYLGRIIKRKGIQIAIETCKFLNKPLIIAGQGVLEVKGNTIYCEDGGKYTYDNMTFVGHANVEQRSQLLSNAKGVFVPTTYIEPFGTVAVEAQMCGTPVITTDWGAFPETVEQGKTGYRCRTLKDFVAASLSVNKLNCEYIRQRALQNYSMDIIRYKYDSYFRSLLDLYKKGWYTV